VSAGIQFKAPWGRLLVGTSVFASVVCLGVPLLIVSLGPQVPALAQSVAITMPLAMIGGCAVFVVRGYTVTADALLIHRLAWDSRIPLRNLRSIEAMPGAMAGSIRTFGNGGFFSFTGFFWSRRLGRFRAYATDLQRTVVLRLVDRTVVVTPDDPGRFVQEIKMTQIPIQNRS
jgi:hypothetical protein